MSSTRNASRKPKIVFVGDYCLRILPHGQSPSCGRLLPSNPSICYGKQTNASFIGDFQLFQQLYQIEEIRKAIELFEENQKAIEVNERVHYRFLCLKAMCHISCSKPTKRWIVFHTISNSAPILNTTIFVWFKSLLFANEKMKRLPCENVTIF